MKVLLHKDADVGFELTKTNLKNKKKFNYRQVNTPT